MPDDDPPSDDAPQELGETPAMTPGTLCDERHFIVGLAVDITEQQHPEENLRDSEESVRRLIDAIPQIVWTNNVDGTARDFNRRWYEYTGLNYEQSTGPGWQAIIHPDDAPVSRERWQRALETGELFECEYRLRNAAGEYRWFIGRNVPVRANDHIIGWVGSATDVHDLKQAESGRRESEERYRLMVDGARDYAIFMLNPSNEMIYWSAYSAGALPKLLANRARLCSRRKIAKTTRRKRKSRRRCEKAAQAIGAGTFARTARESGWTA
jgi:PAS domain S-box-containing protein